MDQLKHWQTISYSSQVTENIGKNIAHNIKGGEIIELISDLGGGKTTFVRGLAEGLNSPDHVSSPTFKISNVYSGKDLTINHFDLYRLTEAGIMSDEIAEVINDKKAVTIIEWADTVKHILPAKRLIIEFQLSGENERQLNINYPESLSYLLKGLI